MKNEHLLDLVSKGNSKGDLPALSLFKRIKENEIQLEGLKKEQDELEERISLNAEREIDLSFVLQGLGNLRSEKFRKANLSKKRRIVRNVIKSILIHPDNTIMIRLWGRKENIMPFIREENSEQGVVL